MSRARVATLLALVAAGCSPIADRCSDGTLLVAVTLDHASAAADSFAVSLSIDGALSVQKTVPHRAGAASGNLLVTFPHGYPRGHAVTVDVDALVAGVIVGSGHATQPLAGGCEVAPLDIVAATVQDLGTVDLGPDLASGADMTSLPPDMVCVPSAGSETADSCFDGIDNDCDGHIDCDDPDCTMAQCVPAPSAAFTLGITVAEASFCPALFTSKIVIDQGLTASSPDCPANSCTCTAAQNCTSDATAWPQSMCMGESQDVSLSSTCRGFSTNQTSTGITTSTITNGGGACNKGGTSTPSATQWASIQRFCGANKLGGGCHDGAVCVPNLSVPICEIATGAVGCDTGYTASASPWYTGFTDGRSCSCKCGLPSGGACGTSFSFFTSDSCGGTPAVNLAQNAQNCSFPGSTIHSSIIAGTTLPSCGAPTTVLGGTGLAGTGQQTVCCRP